MIFIEFKKKREIIHLIILINDEKLVYQSSHPINHKIYSDRETETL